MWAPCMTHQPQPRRHPLHQVHTCQHVQRREGPNGLQPSMPTPGSLYQLQGHIQLRSTKHHQLNRAQRSTKMKREMLSIVPPALALLKARTSPTGGESFDKAPVLLISTLPEHHQEPSSITTQMQE